MTRLHHMGITVRDSVAATEFYQAVTQGEAIGPLVKSGPAVDAATGYTNVEVVLTFIRVHGEVFIELAEYRGADNPRVDPDNGFIGAAHPAIVVDDVDATLARVAGLGYRPLSATMTATAGPLEGYRYVYVLGPDKVRVELLQAPR